ncbi:hypothetical protein FQN50_009034 [Emmonsiellopsis sp. PD_5]|nr:hypothetical protein FQN50_009034 [Emmonsiellopsis sp. PD_5]
MSAAATSIIPPRHQHLLASLNKEAEQEEEPSNIQLAIRILQISDTQQRSLTENELVDALAVDDDDDDFNAEKREPIRKTLRRFKERGFVSKTTTVAVGQETVRWDESRSEYCADVMDVAGSGDAGGLLLSEDRWVREAHAVFARICLVYLRHLATSKGQRAKEFPFAHYAARFWMRHAEKAEEEQSTALLDSPLATLEASFLSSEACVEKWLQIHDDEEEQLRNLIIQRRYGWVPAHRSPLYHAAFYGLRHAMKLLFATREKEAESTITDSDAMQEAVYAACFQGRLSILHDLLGRGVSANADYGPFETPLAAAAAGGHADIMQCLLTHGATFPTDVDDAHPLVVAALIPHHQQAVVRIVAHHLVGAERQHALDYALMTAVKRNSDVFDDVIDALLQAGADTLCVLDGEQQSALETVLMGGSHSTVRSLIAASDPQALRLGIERYLELASASGDADLVEFLLSRSGQVGIMQLSRYVNRARLISAVGSRTPTLDEVQDLLNKEPQWQDIRDRDGRSLLRLAVRKGRTEIPALLFCHMQNEPALSQEDTLDSLLLEAIQIASKDAVNFLLQHAADPGSPDCAIITAKHLHVAARMRNLAIFRMLLAAAAPADNRDLALRDDDMGTTLLHTIAAAHHYREAELSDWALPALDALLRHHPPPPLEEKDALGRTALHCAAAFGNVGMVRMLLGHGARAENVVVDEVVVVGRVPIPYADDVIACRDLLDSWKTAGGG